MNIIPKIYMGCTIHIGSDSKAASVIKVISNKTLLIQEDKSTRIDSNGMSEDQTYKYDRDPLAPIYRISLRKDGRWKISKTNKVVTVGVRKAYHDYSF